MTSANHPTTDATLCFIVKDKKILLIMKKRGFGEGKYNAPGGKISSNESIIEAAIRETREETGLEPLNLEKRGILDFYFGKSKDPQWKVHVFLSHQYTGKLIETQETKGEWFPLKEIPYNLMWEDDKFWLPKVLAGKSIRGKFWFTKDMAHLLNHTLAEEINGF